MRILFLSPVQPLLTKGKPLPKWQMQASWARALGRLGHEVRVVKYTPDDRIRLNWGERVWWNFKVLRDSGIIGDSRRHFFGTLGQGPSFTSSSPLGQSTGKVLSGSSSMTSKMASSDHLPSFENGPFDLIIYSLGADVLLPQALNLLKTGLPHPFGARNDGIKLVVLSGVSPIKQGNPRERAMAPLVDLAATNDGGHAEEWLKLGAKRAVVLPIAGVDPELHYPRWADPRYHFLDTLGLGSSLTASSPLGQFKSKALSGFSLIVSKMTSSGQPLRRIRGIRGIGRIGGNRREKDIDVLFVGTVTAERKRFFDELRRLLPKTVRMVIKEFVWEEEFAGLMSRAKIGINLLRPEMKRGVNLRTFEIPAFGAMEITSFCREEWLVPGKEVEVFGSAKEAAEMVKKYLRDDGARERMAAAGQERVMKEHTFDRRAERLMEIVTSFALGYLVGGNLLVRRHPLVPTSVGTRGKPLATLGVASDGSSLTRKFANFDSFSSAKLVDDKNKWIDISVCIVNYKADEELRRCLESVKKFTKGVSYEAIVIDNSENNRWYSGGNNLAASRAKGRYVLFLNPDCWLENDAITELVNFMDKHPKAGAAEPRQAYESGEAAPTGSLLPKWWIDAVEMTGLSGLFGRLGNLGILGRLGRLGKFGELDKYRQIQFDRKKNFKTDVISGAAMMVRKEVLDKISAKGRSASGGGGFDERLKLYYTDVDLCRRIKRAGWEIWHVGETAVRHKTRASTSKLPWERLNLIYAADGREYYRKWGEGIGGKILYWGMKGNSKIIKIINAIKIIKGKK